MSKRIMLAGLWAIAFTASFAVLGGGSYQLPSDPGQPVITLDFKGSRLKRIDASPALSIYADGRVVMPQLYAHSVAREGRISQQQLQALLDLIVVSNKFFLYDPRQVEAKLAALPGPRPALPMHLASTEITVHVNQHAKTVSYFGLGHDAMVEESAQLLAIRRRLEQLMSTLMLGGEKEVAAWLALANQRLASERPKSEPLSLDDLESGTLRTDGSVFVRFVRPASSARLGVAVSISVAADGRNSVTVATDRPQARSTAPAAR
jgi:hypothetical protein